MKLLAIMRPENARDVRAEVAGHAAAELRALWELYKKGIVREMYSPGDPGAMLILEADSLKEAERALATKPLLAGGIMGLGMIELRPFGALEMLFS